MRLGERTQAISVCNFRPALHSGRKLDSLGLSGNLNFSQSIIVDDKGGFIDLAVKILEGAGNFGHNLAALLKFRFAPVGNDFVFAGREFRCADQSWLP